MASPRKLMRSLGKELPPEDTPYELRTNARKPSTPNKESVASKIVKFPNTSDINNTLSLSTFSSLSYGFEDSGDDLIFQNRGKTFRDKLRQKRVENPYAISDSTLNPAPTENTIDDLGLSDVSLDESIDISKAKIEIKKKRKRRHTEVEFLNLTNAVSKLSENVNNDVNEDRDKKNNPKSPFRGKRQSVLFDVSPLIDAIPQVNLEITNEDDSIEMGKKNNPKSQFRKKRKSVHFDIDFISQMKKNKSEIVDDATNSSEVNENTKEINKSVTSTLGTNVDVSAKNTLDSPRPKRSIHLSPNSTRKQLESPKSIGTTPTTSKSNPLSSNELELHKSRSSNSVSAEVENNESSMGSHPSSPKSSAIHLEPTKSRRSLIVSPKLSTSKLSALHTPNANSLTNPPQSNDNESDSQESSNKNISIMSPKLITEKQSRSPKPFGSLQNISSTTKANVSASTSTVAASSDRNANINISVSPNIDKRMFKSPVKGVYENPETETIVSGERIHKSSEEFSSHEGSKHGHERQLDLNENFLDFGEKRIKMTPMRSPQISQEGHENLIGEKLGSSMKISSPTIHNNLDSEMNENNDHISNFESFNPTTTHKQANLSTRRVSVSSPVAGSSMNPAGELLSYPTTSSNFDKLPDESLQGTITINRNKKRCSNSKGSPKPSTSKSGENKSGQLKLKEFLERLKNKQTAREPEPDLLQEMVKKPKDLLEINEKYEKEKSEKKKEIPKKKKETKIKTNLPPKMNDTMFKHFLKHELTKEGSEELQEIVGEFFKNLAEDIQVVLTSTNDKLINKENLFILMKKLKIVSNWEELYALTEELLPANEWKKLVPIQYAHNQIFPKAPRERRGGHS